MAKSISAFSGHIQAKGLASPNKFNVKFENLPDIIPPDSYQGLNLTCESVAIAGRTVQSILNREYGVNREVAYNGPTYQPVTLSFLCTEDWAAKKIFDAWNNMIVDIGNGYDIAYYSEYAKAIMTVTALNRKADSTAPSYFIKYMECFPKSVAAIEMNHSTVNATLRMTVEMSYAYWETDQIKMGQRAGTGRKITLTNTPLGFEP